MTGLRETETRRIFELRDYFWKELKKIYPKAEINGIKNPSFAEAPADSVRQRTDLADGSAGRQESRIKNGKPIIHNSLFIIPGILNVYFPEVSSADLLIKLDMAGIAVSSGSACSVRSPKPSHVLGALGLPPLRQKSSLRFSFGKFTTREEVDEALKILNETLNG